MFDSIVFLIIIFVCLVCGSVIYLIMVQYIDVSCVIFINVIEVVMSGEKVIFIVLQCDKDVDDFKGEDFYDVGIVCNVLCVCKNFDGILQMLVSVVVCVQVSVYQFGDYFIVDIELLDVGKLGGVEL